MPTRRDTRRLAMQVLYQIDVRGQDDLDAIRAGLEMSNDAPAECEPAFELACEAWEQRADCDALVMELAPDWPTHRQPPIDRAILRLAYHEIVSGHAPGGVAINEAVVLAKQFCSEQSPGFINGVLDKMARKIARSSTETAVNQATDTADDTQPADPPPTDSR